MEPVPPDKQIVAFGGHSVAAGVIPPLYDYALSVAGVDRPRICDLPTASDDSPDGLINYLDNRIPAERAKRSHLALFGRTVRDIRPFLLDQHVIIVGGGNTANMLAVWRAHGVDPWSGLHTPRLLERYQPVVLDSSQRQPWPVALRADPGERHNVCEEVQQRPACRTALGAR